MANAPVTDRLQFPEIKLDGSSMPPAVESSLRSCRIELSLWMPSRCSLRFYDADFDIVDGSTFALGKAVKISLPTTSGELQAVFDGEITDLALESTGGGIHELVVGAMDKGHRLAAQTQLRTFQNQTYSQIVQTIAGEAGLTPNVTATSPAMSYVIQATNDHAFLSELAGRVGYDWWVSSDGKLNFAPMANASGPTLKLMQDLIEFKVRYSGAVKGSELTVQGWDPETQEQVTGTDDSALSGSAIPKIGGSSTFVTEGRSKAVSGWAKPLKTGAFGAANASEAKGVAKALAAQVDAAEVFARGLAMSTPALVPGKNVTIEGMGTKVSGDYVVTTVEHTFGDGAGIETRFTAGNKAPVGFADLVGGGTVQPDWGAVGLVVGVVTNLQDPDSVGRVRVKFPSLSTEDEGGWARVVGAGAGNEYGVQFMPEINDEVLVGFEHGDRRFPVVLGGLWSNTHKPPSPDLADTVKLRTIKSKLGHAIELSDGDGDDTKSVTITLADGTTKLRLGHDGGTLEVADGKPFVLKAGSHKIEIDANGGITLKGQKITLDAATDLELKGTNIKITGSANVEMKANANVKISGTAGANLESSAIAVVKGTMVKIN